MIKILHVTPQMDFGGVASVVKNYYSVLNHKEVIFDFVTHGKEEQYHKDMIADGSRFYYFNTIGKIGIKGYVNQIKNSIDLDNYDIVHIHVGDLTGVYALTYRICGAKKVINHGHGSEPVMKKRKYISWFLRLLANREADICIGCGKKAGDFMFGRGNYILLPNGINFSRFQNIDTRKKEEIKTQLGLENRFVVTNVGNLQEVKNQQFIVRTIGELIKEIPNIMLVLAGEGSERYNLEQIVEELELENYVILPGLVTCIPELLSLSDVFVMPSLHEGIPVSAIEAQAVGLPCVLSDTIDPDIDIGNSHTYFIPINKGIDEWVRVLKNINDNKEKWGEELHVHEKLKEKGYDVEENAGKLMSIYKRLVEQV